MALNALFEIMHVVTGLSRDELLDAVTNHEKLKDAMLKVSQHAAEKAGRFDLAAKYERTRNQE